MRKHNPENERIKREYFDFLKESKGKNSATIDAVAAALSRFEQHNRLRSFKAFHHEQAINFKKHLTDSKAARTGEKLSKSTLHSTMRHLRAFFEWLCYQPGYRGKFTHIDASYFSIPAKDQRVANADRPSPYPSLDEVLRVISQMPSNTDLEKRDRALIAFALATGIRDRALASLKLMHVNLDSGCVFQDARQVQTKFSKTITTYFFQVGDEPLGIVVDWVRFLRAKPGFGPDSPLFPSTAIGQNAALQFVPVGLDCKHWQGTGPIRKIFRKAFESAGLPYYNPHSIRKTLGALGSQRCKTPEQFKAWSQNLGHEKVLTTFTNYGVVQDHRQRELLKQLDGSRNVDDAAVQGAMETFAKLAQAMAGGRINP